MPQGVIFTLKDYSIHERVMIEEKKWEPINKRDTKELLQQLEAKPPYEHPHAGMEEGFTKFIVGKGLRLIEWNSFDRFLGTTRVGWDRGHVGMLQSNRFVYYGPELRRTEKYFQRLETWADVLEDRARNRPTCSVCGRLLEVMTTEYHQHYWYCQGYYLRGDHPWVDADWDVGLKDSTLEFLHDKRENTRKYNILRLSQGKPKRGFGEKQRRIWTYGT